jgi:hypothetical protein
MNNLNKLPLGVDFTAGGLNQLQITQSAFVPNSLRIYSANFLQCMNVIKGVAMIFCWGGPDFKPDR